MEIGPTLYVTDRKEWRYWLSKNFLSEKEIWVIYPHISSGKKRIPYNDAVEEALCFGWIDSIVKKYDSESSAQRFSPRNPKSKFSQLNKERLKWLLKKNMVHKSIIPRVVDVAGEKFNYPPDIIAKIKQNPEAWQHFQKFPAPYKRIRVAYIEIARSRPEIFTKRLSNFITKTEKNKIFGFAGIEKYF